MLAPLLIGVAVAAGALLLVRRSSRPATQGGGAVTVRPPPPADTQPAVDAKTSTPSPADQRPTVNRTRTAVGQKVLRGKAGDAVRATPSQDTPHADTSLADLAAIREKPGYKAYLYPVLGTFGYSENYAHGEPPLLRPDGLPVPEFVKARTDGELAAFTQLRLTVAMLRVLATQMSDQEWLDFWIIGVVPERFAPNDPSAGRIGGWRTPYIEGALNYGVDGGMWNALVNFWKNGAATVVAMVPVVGGIASTGIKAIPVNTQANKFGAGR